MKKLFFLLFFAANAAAISAQSVQGYNNPVIPGYHPDPSVCRVGDDFYLVNSSFQYFPGVPIFHSRDLIHWEQIGNVLDRASQVSLKGATSWQGIYAPTIRYHEGTYYMITTNVGNGGNFMVTATDPSGPWSEPIWLKQQGIDPSLYFENGKCYMVSNPDDAIWLCEIDPKTGEQLTESRQLWRGTGGRYPEGPHIYKKDGYYYLLISEGGTEYGHSITIARSKKIEGPYKSNPDNPILCHQRRITQTSQIQGTGHADLVQASDGSWWMMFLAFRTYGGNYHHLGRETFLAPVKWEKKGWPVVNVNGTVELSMKVPTLPQTAPKPVTEHFTFPESLSDPGWLMLQNPQDSMIRPASRINDDLSSFTALRLKASKSTLSENDRPSFLGRRQESVNISLTTRVSLACEGDSLVDEAEGGLTVYQINDGHYDLFLRCQSGVRSVGLRCRLKAIDYIVAEQRLDDADQFAPVELKVESDEALYHFYYRLTADDEWHKLGALDTILLSSEAAGGFTGVVLGMYASSPVDGDSAVFDYFELKEK